MLPLLQHRRRGEARQLLKWGSAMLLKVGHDICAPSQLIYGVTGTSCPIYGVTCTSLMACSQVHYELHKNAIYPLL